MSSDESPSAAQPSLFQRLLGLAALAQPAQVQNPLAPTIPSMTYAVQHDPQRLKMAGR